MKKTEIDDLLFSFLTLKKVKFDYTALCAVVWYSDNGLNSEHLMTILVWTICIAN